MCKICTHVTPNVPQVTLGQNNEKAFTFDCVYDTDSTQEAIFDSSVRSLLDGCLDGYNATVLAYGQTGSGKTYTMGTAFDETLGQREDGIIPRAIHYLFEQIEHRQQQEQHEQQARSKFTVSAQFMELYNEEIIDLFDASQSRGSSAPTAGASVTTTTTTTATSASVYIQSNSYLALYNDKSDGVNGGGVGGGGANGLITSANTNTIRTKIVIHEDKEGGIYLNGCSSRPIACAEEV
jgi:hypothetical protein